MIEELKEFRKDLEYSIHQGDKTLQVFALNRLDTIIHKLVTDEDLALVSDRIRDIATETERLHPYKQLGNPETYCDYNQGWSDACDVLGETIIDKICGR